MKGEEEGKGIYEEKKGGRGIWGKSGGKKGAREGGVREEFRERYVSNISKISSLFLAFRAFFFMLLRHE